MTEGTIYVSGKKYFYHETYESFKEAQLIGKYYKKESNSTWWIIKDFTRKKPRYHLYLNNIWNAI